VSQRDPLGVYEEFYTPTSNLPARQDPNALETQSGFYRDPEAGKLTGVCSGLANTTNIPAVVWRFGFIFTTLLGGIGLPLYAILWFAMDKAPKRVISEPTPKELSAEDREIWDAVKEEMASLGLRNDD